MSCMYDMCTYLSQKKWSYLEYTRPKKNLVVSTKVSVLCTAFKHRQEKHVPFNYMTGTNHKGINQHIPKKTARFGKKVTLYVSF